mgnify:CR=1 FL=1
MTYKDVIRYALYVLVMAFVVGFFIWLRDEVNSRPTRYEKILNESTSSSTIEDN